MLKLLIDIDICGIIIDGLNLIRHSQPFYSLDATDISLLLVFVSFMIAFFTYYFIQMAKIEKERKAIERNKNDEDYISRTKKRT